MKSLIFLIRNIYIYIYIYISSLFYHVYLSLTFKGLTKGENQPH